MGLSGLQSQKLLLWSDLEALGRKHSMSKNQKLSSPKYRVCVEPRAGLPRTGHARQPLQLAAPGIANLPFLLWVRGKVLFFFLEKTEAYTIMNLDIGGCCLILCLQGSLVNISFLGDRNKQLFGFEASLVYS